MRNEPKPDGKRTMSRRAVVKLAVVGVAGISIGAGSTVLVTKLGKTTPPRWQFFSDEEAALLAEICEQLIPRDDTVGATDAGVIRYIDRQLAGNLVRHQETYRRGLVSFHQACVAESGAPFLALAVEKKVEALRRVEMGRSAEKHWSDPTPQEFFRLVLIHTMQGFYGPARHGGNRDYVSYKILGLNYPQVVGQNRYRKEEARP